MDVFSSREAVVRDYQRYVTGVIRVKEARAKGFVEHDFAPGDLWNVMQTEVSAMISTRGRWGNTGCVEDS
jgi:hypothetical protein